MARADLSLTTQKDWLVALPWPWFGAGATLTLWALTWTLTFRDQANDFRVIPLALGLFSTAVGVWLRWNDRQTVYVSACSKPLALVARRLMAAGFALLALGVTILLAIALFPPHTIPWKPAATFLVWLTVAPASLAAAWRLWKRAPDQPVLEPIEEVGLCLVVAAFFCFLGSLALGPGNSWDTIQMVLRVLWALSLLTAALILAPMWLRRLALSMIITLHFTGIATACMSAPPTPAIMLQLWTRLFRPYLEFLYLNNAYHFYAPEPNATSYLWFRYIYQETGNESKHGSWYKVPNFDEKGLAYLRFIPMTASVTPTEPSPNFMDEKGQVIALYRQRIQMQPGTQPVIGFVQPDAFRIPGDPVTPIMMQYAKPTLEARELLKSYARFVARKFATDPEHPDWKIHSIKIYRVLHKIPTTFWLNDGLPPDDPVLYQPFFLGTYGLDGSLLEPDPYLYWELPILRVFPNHPLSKIRDFARLHAGDPDWVRPELRDASQLTDPPKWGPPDDEDEKLVKP